jgi:pilus assembly protein CpaC
MLTTTKREMKMGKQHNGLTALFMALALAGSCSLFSASAVAAETTEYAMPEQGTMELTLGRDGLAPIKAVVGKSFIMRTGKMALKRISVTDPTVIDYTLLSPTELYMLPKSYGTTNITLWTKDGKTAVLDIDVDIDTAELQGKLAQLLPNEKNITVTTAAKSIVLQGTVSNPEALSQAVDIANAYVRYLNRDIVLPIVAGTSKVGAGTQISVGSGTSIRQASAVAGVQVINMLRVTDPMQVMLEVKVAEVSKGLLDQLGAKIEGATLTNHANGDSIGFATDLLALISHATVSGATATTNNALTLNVGNSTITINAQKGDNVLRLLAEPNIMAISGQEGSFLSGGKIYIPVLQNSTGGGSAGGITLQEQDFGVLLNFLPTVLANGRINLKVSPEVSEVTGTTNTNWGQIPTLSVRKASTTVQLNDGQSFAIAGLIKNNLTETVNRIPMLGEIPILGALFRSSEFQEGKTELMFVVTPHLVKPLPPNYQLPTDSFKAPNRPEYFLEGRMESATPPAAPAAAAPKANPDNLRMN